MSMDDEVFLVSRIREAYDATGDTVEAVARGLAATGRVITSAALIMMVVFLGFVANPSPFVTMIGLGLAVAIALDATVVRMLLVPATMTVLGRANWSLPGWLDRLVPRVHTGTDVSAALTGAALVATGSVTATAAVPATRPGRRRQRGAPVLTRRATACASR